jgi:hypothetical protein
MLSMPDCRGAFPDMTYPVIANDPALVMVNTAALRAIGTRDDGGEASLAPDLIAFSLQALAKGYRHLCTSTIRATAVGARGQNLIPDPPGLSCFGPQRWEDVLSSIAVLRELH